MMEHSKNIARLRENSNFLGFEFLSWLFLLLDHDNAQERVSQITKGLVYKTEVQVVLGNKLVTCLLTHREQKTSVASPLLEASHEVFASLRNGHLVESLAVNVALAEITIGLTLHASDFAFTQVKIKNNYESESLSEDEEALSEQDKNQEEVFLRLAAIDDAERVINGLYEHWVKQRMNSRDQAREVAGMREQIEKRLGSYIAKSDTRGHNQAQVAEA